jgi:hypothetical protein
VKDAILAAIKSPAAGSAARWLVAFLLGLFGVKVADEQAGELAAAALALAGLTASVWLSRRADARQIESAVKTVADLRGEMTSRGEEAAKEKGQA